MKVVLNRIEEGFVVVICDEEVFVMKKGMYSSESVRQEERHLMCLY
jgi:hypothetical protein